MEQTAGKMYLASERGHTETDWFRSYHTFQFGAYTHSHKQPFGSLYVLNDDTLAGGRTTRLLVEDPTVLCLLPVVGAIEYKDSEGRETVLEAGETQLFYLPKNAFFSLTNPFEKDLVNFLQLWFKCGQDFLITTQPKPFLLHENQNGLVEIATLPGPDFFIKLSIGQFDGRAEAIYPLVSPAHSLFAFVVQGAFEIANRLLENRDALGLWNVGQVKCEALSNQAIILIIEMST